MNQSKFTPNPVYYHTPIKRGFMKIGNGDYKDTRSPKGRCQKKKQDFMGISLPPSVQKFGSTTYFWNRQRLLKEIVSMYTLYISMVCRVKGECWFKLVQNIMKLHVDTEAAARWFSCLTFGLMSVWSWWSHHARPEHKNVQKIPSFVRNFLIGRSDMGRCQKCDHI